MAWAVEAQKQQNTWSVAGFLDTNPEALREYSDAYAILGDPALYIPGLDEVLICAIGDPTQRLKVCRELKGRGASFATLIHPAAIVGPRCCLGEGCVLCPGAVVTTDATLGAHVILNVGACVGHDAVLGDGCTLSPHCDIGGFARLGEGVFMGSHADVLPSAQVGDYAVIGAGSVVLRRVKAHTTVVGVPAVPVFVRQTPTPRTPKEGEQ